MLNFMHLLFFLLAVFPASASAKQTARTEVSYTVLPLVFEKEYGYPLTVITIQGVKIPLAVDLGGAGFQLAISPVILKQFNIQIKYTGKVYHGQDAQGVKSTLREFILPKAQLGGLIINNIKGIEFHPCGGVGAPKNGNIGLDLLAKFKVIIDYKNAKLILIKGNSYPPGYDIGSWPKIPFTMIDGNLVTSTRINDKTKILIWDTGAPLSTLKSTVKISGELKSCSKTVLFKLATTPNDCKAITTKFVMSNYNFGRMTFYIYPMPGLPVDGFIGDDFFKDHIVYIDFTKRILAINKLSDKNVQDK